MQHSSRNYRFHGRKVAGGMVALFAATFLACGAGAQQASVSAWDAADFRTWSFIPYWTSQSQVQSFAADNMYDHVSDVLYFSGVRPTASGALNYHSAATQHLATLKSQAASEGFRFHMSMFDTSGGDVETVWNSITSNPATRATFVNNVKNLLQANNMTGFNLDWERPNTVAEWANYTQLALDLKNTLGPLGMEISVDDYGFASSQWDDSAVFDANIYDQLFIMAYHASASQYATYANTKLALTGQGAAKAFEDNQLVPGIGTWGTNGPGTVSLKNIVAANPNLPADALTFTGTVNDINGVSRTGTWDIQSRYQVREIVQLALDRGMPGVMNWTLHYDATNQLSLHRVAHHYIVVKRNAPDLNLDGEIDATDANTLANNMGTVPGWTGTNTAARFEDFYISGNWEQGDYNGNGFVNQQDANWLATRFATLGVNLPDRLAYTGTFENYQNSQGLAGRWGVVPSGGNLPETGNYTQHAANYLAYAGTGSGAAKHSNSTVTLRNQNAAEAYDSLNTQDRVMRVDLAQPIDLAEDESTYFTVLVRQNTGPLLAAQLASPNRTLSLEFRDAAGVNQFDFALLGSQSQFAVRSQADATGQDVSANGFAADATYLLVGKITGNGAGANTLQASLFDSSATVGNFTNPSFPWMLTALGSVGFNPTITQLGWTSPYVANYSVSNVWIGNAANFFTPPAAYGDFNENGAVDAADYSRWRDGLGTIYTAADFEVWKSHFGQSFGAGAANSVPEPASVMLLAIGSVAISCRTRRNRWKL
jgi:hypothetical protein